MDSDNSGSFIIIVAMSAEYNKAVLDAYQRIKAENRLPPNLKLPTPGMLRDQCELVCRERYEERDEMTLKTFFGEGRNKETFLKAMANFDVNRFKPLIRYLNGVTNRTDPKNIELLAWLIDFERRPFQFDVDYRLSEPVVQVEKTVARVTEPVVEVDNPEGNRDRGLVRTFNSKMAYATLVVILAIIGIGVYFVRERRTPPPPTAWMRWVGDHFKQVPNSESLGDTVAFPLDSAVLLHFKRITDTCVITVASIGRVWYAKINGKLLFYNSLGLGFDPVDTQFRLKPLTRFMISKHVNPCQ